MKKIIILFWAFLLLFLSAGCRGEYGFMHGGGRLMDYGYGCGYGGVLMWVFFLIAVGILVYLILRVFQTRDQSSAHSESPLDILKKRYAKGEIGKEDFERVKKDLEN